MSELKKLDFNNVKASVSSLDALSAKLSSKSNQPSSRWSLINILAILIAILAGAGTGYAAYKFLPGSVTGVPSSTTVPESGLKVGDIIGVPDEKTFKDFAEGILEKGGLDGEGSHKLVRSGGVSQTVYLTSSVIDLDEFTGHKVKIWGETFKAQKAGWLMDVGRVQVLELNATKPE